MEQAGECHWDCELLKLNILEAAFRLLQFQNCLLYTSGAVGIANMWFAIFADVGVMILAVLNAIRALYVHRL